MDGRRVDIEEKGRYGTVHYREPAGTLSFHWEFGGGDVVASVQVGTAEEWRSMHPWAVDRRATILRHVADEVVRQKAPNCTAEVDERTGWMHLRTGTSAQRTPENTRTDAKFVRRYTSLKAIVGMIVLVVALIFGGVMWFTKKVLSIDTGKGVPLGQCLRTDAHISTLIQSTDPHLPEISGRGGNTTTSISILIIPLDGSAPKKIEIAEGLSPNEYTLAKILGSDGRVLWFDVHGIGGVDLKTMEQLEPSEVRDPYVPNSSWPFEISADTYLSAGSIVAPGQWFGLHSEEELKVEFAPKKFLRRVVPQESRKQMRRFIRGTLDAPVDDKYHQILSMESINEATYFNAAFLRMDDASEPIRMSDPDGALMIHTSVPGLEGTTIISRVDLSGKVLWSVDTEIDRFKLSQILPGKDLFAFVGTRPPIPDKLSEPLLVVVENGTGKTHTISLWQ